MLTALIDYESGNLHSAQKAFERMAAEAPNEEVIVTSDPDMLRRAIVWSYRVTVLFLPAKRPWSRKLAYMMPFWRRSK